MHNRSRCVALTIVGHIFEPLSVLATSPLLERSSPSPEMHRQSTNTSTESERARRKHGQSIVFVRLNQSLSVVDNEDLLHVNQSRVPSNIAPMSSILTDLAEFEEKSISPLPWKSTKTIQLPKSGQAEACTCNVPVDNIAPHMWLRRLFGTVRKIRVYDNPIFTVRETFIVWCFTC